MSWLSKIIGGDKDAAHKDGKDADAALHGARLLIDRHSYSLAELGVRSFRVHPYEGELIEKQNFAFTLVFTLGGEEIQIAGRGVVRQITPKDGLVAQFNAPQPFLDRKLIDFVAHTRSPHHLSGPAAKHSRKPA